MTFARTARFVLPIIVAAAAFGLTGTAMASVLIDTNGASVEGPEAASAVPAQVVHATRRIVRQTVIATAKGATNLRATPTALLVIGVDASR
jgi:hypothetical protein